jgi:hypothetical protein
MIGGLVCGYLSYRAELVRPDRVKALVLIDAMQLLTRCESV